MAQAGMVACAVWPAAVNGVSLTWPAALALAVFIGLVLFGLHKYRAHDRRRGMRLVRDALAVTLCLAAWSLSQTEDPLGVIVMPFELLPPVVVWSGGSTALALGLTGLVWLLTRRTAAPRRHWLRALAAAVLLAPALTLGATEMNLAQVPQIEL